MHKLNMCLVLFLVSGVCSASSESRHYQKCYLKLENGHKVVAQFVTKDNDLDKLITSLPGRKVFMEDGISYQNINKALECVSLKDSFSHKKARKLESETGF